MQDLFTLRPQEKGKSRLRVIDVRFFFMMQRILEIVNNMELKLESSTINCQNATAHKSITHHIVAKNLGFLNITWEITVSIAQY